VELALTPRWLMAIGTVIGLIATYYLIPMTGQVWWLGFVLGPVAAVVLVPLAFRNARRILTGKHPLAEVVRALAVVVAVLVLGFAASYYALEHHWPGEVDGLRTKTDAMYFSITTVATVGYGDIHPTGQLARLIASVHMLANVVLIGVSVRLVSWAIRQRVTPEG
jgi:hypothetical protein